VSLFNELKRRNVFKVGTGYLVLSWVIIQVTDTAVPALHLPEWVNSLVFFLGAIGFPFALFFAWAFEITPEGVKKESEVDRDESITTKTGKKLEFAIFGLLVFGLGYFFWESRIENVPSNTTISSEVDSASAALISKKPTTNPASIAVLAFSDLSPKGDQEYFSDGISEEILNVLVKIESLEVSSRTSSFQFKGREIGIPEIAKSLKVRHVLEGSVRKAGDTIRITAQLIDAENDKHLWSETYDRPLDVKNIFAIQDEIAHAIVKALSLTLDSKNRASIEVVPTTENLTAYDLFLKARPMFQARSQLNIADDLLKQAIELDSKFATAWEMRAALQTLKIDYGFSNAPIEEAQKLGNEFAQHALSIQPKSALAIAVMAKNKHDNLKIMRGGYKLSEIIEDFAKSLSIDPRNPSALNWRGLAYLHTGNIKLAIQDFENCQRYEPYYEPCVENYNFNIALIKPDQVALEQYIKTLDLGINKLEYVNLFTMARLKQEFIFKAITNHRKVLRGWHRHNELYQAYLNPEKTYSELSSDILDFIKTNPERNKEVIADILLRLGHYQPGMYYGTQWDKSNQKYRQSTQFKTYMHKTGVFEYWQETGFPPQCRALGEDDFECD
jgi:TolB-like protein